MEKLALLTAEESEKQFSGPSEFSHLHCHTLFSILDGVAAPDDYFKACVERNWPAVAITEHGVLNSIPDAYLASKEFKKKYIVGCEIYFNDYELKRRELATTGVKVSELRTSDPELAMRIGRNRHLTVLCKNMVGYQNLLRLNKYAWENGFYYKPRIWFDQLAKHREGLIILSGCFNGPVSHELRNNNFSQKSGSPYIGAVDYVKKFKEVFGDDYYIELQMPGVDGDIELFQQLAAVADHFKIKTVISNDCHYLNRNDFEIQRLMMAIDQKVTVNDPNLFHVNSDDQYLKTRHELRATFVRRGFKDVTSSDLFERSCDNTLEVADKCATFKPNLEPKLPNIINAKETLVHMVAEGLRKRGLHKDKNKYFIDGVMVTHLEQAQIELSRIIEKGFESYFLITEDLIKCSKSHKWPIGPARGSSGGSLVCYLIGIQSLNPLFWGLSFNRFLSPARGGWMQTVQMPKIEVKT